MSFWTAAVIIVAIISVAEIIKARYRAERRFEKQQRDASQPIPPEDRDARREVDDLRERIKVLERIATDGNSIDARETQRISREIEALRDRQDG